VRQNADFFVTLRPGMKSLDDAAGDIRHSIFMKVGEHQRNLIERVKESHIRELVPSNAVDII
jgi:hypothetical protein